MKARKYARRPDPQRRRRAQQQEIQPRKSSGFKTLIVAIGCCFWLAFVGLCAAGIFEAKDPRASIKEQNAIQASIQAEFQELNSQEARITYADNSK